MNAVKDQYLLRVKRGSPLDRVMSAMDGEVKTNAELAEAGGQAQWGYIGQWILKQTDNVALVKDWGANSQRMNYTHPLGTVPVPYSPEPHKVVEAEVMNQQPDEPMASIRWPDAPPLIESMGDKFRTPGWFNMMKKMVRNGRHIALSGPPGVGKDTAVQELAAEEGKVLVTVGGDAGFRKRDLIGSPQIVRGQSFLDVAEYAAAVVNGWWVLLTEVNAADADALMFINTQLAAPFMISIGGKAYPVHPDFRLFISYNPGLVGTKPLPQSFKDRFFSIQIPFFSAVQLKSVLTAHGALDNPYLTDIVNFGLKAWDAHKRGQLRYQITSRRLMDAVELIQNDIVDTTREAIEFGVLAAVDSEVEQQVLKSILNTL